MRIGIFNDEDQIASLAADRILEVYRAKPNFVLGLATGSSPLKLYAELVRRYQAGRVEATGYDVADAAVAGNSAKALTLTRHAFATGIAPQVLVAALAMKFRAMAKVSIGGSASALKMAPWQVDRARRELRGWSDASLAGAFGAIATADAETKGASRDPQRAIEKAIITICRLHGR